MKRVIGVFTVLFFVLSAFSSFALTEDFTAFMESDINTCQCFPLTKQVIFTNIGDVESQYDLTLQGSAASFATLQPVNFRLQPGESQSVQVNFFSTCEPTGQYPFTILAKTKLSNLEKEIKSDIIINACETIQFQALTASQAINNCETATYDFLLRNYGFQQEVVDIGVDEGIASSVSLLENPVIVSGQTDKKVSLFVAAACDEEGQKTFSTTLTGKNTGISATYDLDLSVTNRDVPLIANDVEEINVPLAESVAELVLANTGYGTVAYTMEVQSGPSWISISPDQITLPQGTEASFFLTSNPPLDAVLGTYDVTLAAVSDSGVAYTKHIQITLDEETSNDKDSGSSGSSFWSRLFGFGSNNEADLDETDTTTLPEDTLQDNSGFGDLNGSIDDSGVSSEDESPSSSQANLPLIFTIIIVLIIILLLLLLLVAARRTKGRRSSSKKAREKVMTDKALSKAEVRDQKLAAKEAKRNALRAQRIRLKEEKLAEKERRRQERIAAKEARIAAREAKKEEKQAAKEAKKQEREAAKLGRLAEREEKENAKEDARNRRLLKNAMIKDLRKDFNFVEKEDGTTADITEEKSPVMWIILIIILLLIIGTVLIWLFFPFFMAYLPFFIAGFAVLIIILILIAIRLRKRENVKALRASSEGRALEKELKKEITDYYDLIPKRNRAEERRLEREAREQEAENQRKLSEKEASRNQKREERAIAREAKKAARASKKFEEEEFVSPQKEPTSFRWLWVVIGIIVLVAGIAILFYFFAAFILLYWMYFALGIIILVIVLLIVDKARFGNQKRSEWDSLAEGESALMPIVWKEGLTELHFTAKNNVQDVQLTVKKLGRPNLADLDAEVYQYIEIEKTNMNSSDIDRALFRFKVKKKWLQKNNVAVSKVKLYRHAGSSWKALPCELIREDEQFMYYESVSAGFSYFVIGGKPSEKQVYVSEEPRELPKKSKRKAKKEEVIPEVLPEREDAENGSKLWILWLVISLILLVLIGFVGYKIMQAQSNQIDAVSSNHISIPPLSEDEQGIPRQVWEMNTLQTLDLSPYFNDPDGDSLTYSALTNSDDISFSFDNAVARLTPSQDFVGEVLVTFVADDGSTQVESNEVRLLVLSPEQLSEEQTITPPSNPTAWWIVLVIVILVVAILFAISHAKRDDNDSDSENDDEDGVGEGKG